MKRDNTSATDGSASQRATILAHADMAAYASGIAIRHLKAMGGGIPSIARRRAEELGSRILRLSDRELLALLADAVDRLEGGK